MSKKTKPNYQKYSNTKRKHNFSKSSVIILTIISILLIIVVVGILLPLFFSTEKSVYSEIDALSKDYYENYLYENLTNSAPASTPESFEKTMQKYQEHGFSTVHLRQILLQNEQKGSSRSVYITKYCDENKTYIKFYPEPPFERTSYRIEYTYSCNF